MTTHVLILCTHNSARSVLAEAMLGHWAARLGRDVRAHSAGSSPSGRIHPLALECLERAGIRTDTFRSKGWDGFAGEGAPGMRIVITVCDRAASEACPIWPGAPVTTHWGYPDPSVAPGGEDGVRQAFELTRQAIGFRMLQLLQLPLADIDDDRLRDALAAIGRS